ncbi:hypothetical protein ACHAQA_000507 [Verticillium albo-atrum]
MKGRSVDQLVFESMFSKSRAGDPPNFHAFLQRTLILEVRSEVHAFYGHLDTQEAKYPGLDYCNRIHRVRLSRWPWHRRLFRAFDSLRLTHNEVANLTKWEGTKWAKERYEKEQGITIRDTAADELSEWIEPEDRPVDSAPRGQTAETEEQSDDEDMDGEETEEEMESVGTALNERLRERVARREAGDLATVLDEEWEQWLKNAIESGELPFTAPQMPQSASPTNTTTIMPTTLFPPRMLSAARAGQWREIPDFLHDLIQRSISVETADREEAPMPPLTRAPARGSEERRSQGARLRRAYLEMHITPENPSGVLPRAADLPGA